MTPHPAALPERVACVEQALDHDGGGSGAVPLWQRTEGALDLATEVLRERDMAVGLGE